MPHDMSLSGPMPFGASNTSLLSLPTPPRSARLLPSLVVVVVTGMGICILYVVGGDMVGVSFGPHNLYHASPYPYTRLGLRLEISTYGASFCLSYGVHARPIKQFCAFGANAIAALHCEHPPQTLPKVPLHSTCKAPCEVYCFH